MSEDAVAPVVSVILMVAVVAILAVIVGAVAFGSVGTQGNSKSVAVTANKGTSGIVFTVQGGADLPSVRALDLVSGSSITNCTGSAPKIGSSCSGGTDSNGRTVMVATFADGSKQVVFDKNWGTPGMTANPYYSITLSRTYASGQARFYYESGTPGPEYNTPVSYDFYENGAFIGSTTGYYISYWSPGSLLWVSTNATSRVTIYSTLSGGSSILIYDHTF